MRYFKNITFLLLLTTVLYCCKKPYTPAVLAAKNSYLVVEGIIDIGTDSTVVKLSRTVNIANVVTTNAVAQATVTIESDQNDKYTLAEIKKGSYAMPGLNLPATTKKYRLRIKTADNQEFLSDFEEAKVTPPIDSIGFSENRTGLQIYANAHDDSNQTHYYRWDYDEAWQFNAKYESLFITNGTAIVLRRPDQSVYRCFNSDTASTIVLGSSIKLSQDKIYQNPITTIASTSEKIGIKYSIMLRQYALSTNAYNFWVNLKKNTEQLGSIFDAQPSNINGNIHNVADATEPVIGYISVSTVSRKRIYITKAQLPSSFKLQYPYDCQLDSMYYSRPPLGGNDVAAGLIPLTSTEIPVVSFSISGSASPGGFMSSSKECVDCTLRGTKKQPAFWQ